MFLHFKDDIDKMSCVLWLDLFRLLYSTHRLAVSIYLLYASKYRFACLQYSTWSKLRRLISSILLNTERADNNFLTHHQRKRKQI